jgi:hypothetical protein
MSLEEALKENTAAMNKLSVLVERQCQLAEQVIAGQQKAIEVATGMQTGPATKTKPAPKAAAKSKAAEKPAAAPEPTAEPTPPPAEDYTGEKGAAALRTLCVQYLKHCEDATETAERESKFARALELLDATKLGELTDASRPKMALWIKTLLAGENVEELADTSDDLLG